MLEQVKILAKRTFPELYQWFRSGYVDGARKFNRLIESDYRMNYTRGWFTDFRRERERMAKSLGYYPDIESPRTISEKILWKKLYVRDPLLTRTTDKLAVRGYVRRKLDDQVVEELLKPIICVTDNPLTLDLRELETPFVIKSNHGSGFNYFVHEETPGGKYRVSKEKETPVIMSSEDILHKCRVWLDTTYGVQRYEWSYLNIKPKIFIEPFLDDILGDRLTDVRLFCFHGRPQYIQIDLHRNGERRTSILDKNFKEIDVKYGQYQRVDGEDLDYIIKNIPKDLVFSCAESLSSEFKFARVDFFTSFKGTRFAEITHYPMSGDLVFEPRQFSHRMGSNWDLDEYQLPSWRDLLERQPS